MASVTTVEREGFKLSTSEGKGPFANIAADVRNGLCGTPMKIPSKYFYDSRGSDLFEQITELPEYYPTRAEQEIINAASAAIAGITKSRHLVELGAGCSKKTIPLLRALHDEGCLESFIPFDISESALEHGAQSVDLGGVETHAIVGDFEHDLSIIPDLDGRLVVFLGGTVGNFGRGQRLAFLENLADTMGPDDYLLLGTDLVKEVEVLEAAYNDSLGVTADFNKNVLAVVNRELNACFDLDNFEHRAFFNTDESRIEMWLDPIADHEVLIGDLDMSVSFGAGDSVLTEISCKFERAGLEQDFGHAGMALDHWFTDSSEKFGLSLARCL